MGSINVERSFDPQDVAATVYHHLGIDARSIYFATCSTGRCRCWTTESRSGS